MKVREQCLPLIECTDLVRVFETAAESVTAVAGLTLSVAEGEFLCIEGASGSGKSTLLNLISGLDAPTSGELTIGGRSLVGMDETQRAGLRLRQVGVVFQENNLIDEFSAVENVLVPLRAAGVRSDIAKAEAMDRLAAVGVEELAKRRPSAMSGGQRQRVGIARALAGGRRILVADEPTGALDSANSQAIYALMRRLSDEGVTVVVASHDPIVHQFADRRILMCDGALGA